MKKFFYSLVILTSLSATAFAQAPEQNQQFIVNAFPDYMPGVVINETKKVIVSEKKAKKLAEKNNTEVYQYTNLQGEVYPGKIRIGDTLLVFNGQPYYSKGQAAYMIPLAGQAKAQNQKHVPKTPEERQQSQQTALQIFNAAVGVLPVLINRNNVSYTGGNWAGASLPTGRN